ncbi:MAG: hypothetical protein NT087_07235 [Deltaproteobacteria bacterium]|nr:hypothetical protein [Deltaproteobacteria bacterium]
MGRYLFFSGCAVAALHLGGFTSGEVLASLLGFLAANRGALLTSGLIGALALVCASLLFGGIGFFNILYVMAKAVYELVQLLLCAMAVASLVFWFDLGINLWLEGGGALAVVLYAWLYAAAFSLRVFDFNHPIKEVLLSFSVLPFFCLSVFWGSGLIR